MKVIPCPTCKGAGGFKGRICPDCDGSGIYFQLHSDTCPRCGKHMNPIDKALGDPCYRCTRELQKEAQS